MSLPNEILSHIVDHVAADEVCGRQWLPTGCGCPTTSTTTGQPSATLCALSETSRFLRNSCKDRLWQCVTVDISCRGEDEEAATNTGNDQLQQLIKALSDEYGTPRRTLERINIIIEIPRRPEPEKRKPRWKSKKRYQRPDVFNGKLTGGRNWVEHPPRGVEDPTCAALLSLAEVLIKCPRLKHVRMTGWVIAHDDPKQSLCDMLTLQCPNLQSFTIDLGPEGDVAQIQDGWQVMRGQDWQELLISPTATVAEHLASVKEQPGGYCDHCADLDTLGRLDLERARGAVPWLVAIGLPTGLPFFFHPLIDKRWMLPVWAQINEGELEWHWRNEHDLDDNLDEALSTIDPYDPNIPTKDQGPLDPNQYTAKEVRDYYFQSKVANHGELDNLYEEYYDGVNDFMTEWCQWGERSAEQHFLIRPAQAFRRLLRANVRTNQGGSGSGSGGKGRLLELDDIAEQVFDLIHTAPELVKWRGWFGTWPGTEDGQGESTKSILRRVAQVLIRPQVDAMWAAIASRAEQRACDGEM